MRGLSFEISCRGIVSLLGETSLPLPVVTDKVVYDDPTAGVDRTVAWRAGLGPEGRETEPLLLTLRTLPRAGDVGENMS
jgi:hypothetical protein